MEESKNFWNECSNIINTTMDEVFIIDIINEQEKQIFGAYLLECLMGLG